jgi:hypothetical protein
MANTSCTIITPASLRSDCCSPSLRNPVRLPSGIDVHLHRNTHYEPIPKKWPKHRWIDQYSGVSYRISTTDNHGSRKTARVKTFGDVIADYSFHGEPKCADANGAASTKQTIGLLQRRHIRIAHIAPIGKESNALEEATSGLIHSIDDVYTVYADPKRDEWQRVIVPALKQVPLSVLVRESGLSRRTIIDARTGRRRPHPNNQRTLVEVLRRSGLVK